MRKATNEELRSAYERLNSCRKVAKIYGMCAQSVHERLTRIGVECKSKIRIFTDREQSVIASNYDHYATKGEIRELAKLINRPYSSLASYASKMGITAKNRPKPWLLKIKNEPEARELFDEFKESNLGLMQFAAKKGMHNGLLRHHIAKRWPDEWDAVIESKAPKQTMYRLGRAFEYQVRDLLKNHGYWVLRSPRSGSIVDLVGIKTGIILLIQCKRSGVIVSRDWNSLFNLSGSIGAVAILAERPTGHGINLWEMTGIKDGTKKAQPRRVFNLEITAAERVMGMRYL